MAEPLEEAASLEQQAEETHRRFEDRKREIEDRAQEAAQDVRDSYATELRGLESDEAEFRAGAQAIRERAAMGQR